MAFKLPGKRSFGPILGLSCIGFLLSSQQAVAIQKLAADGSLKSIKAEKLEEPYDKDEWYAYSKSANFSRWVYSPWTKPQLQAQDGLVLGDVSTQERRSVLISEFNVDTSHLAKGGRYQLLLEKDYSCGDGESTEIQPCTLQLMVRCYGKTQDADWDITFEQRTQKRVDLGTGSFKIEPTIFDMNKCADGLYISSEATVSPQAGQYAFRELRVGLKDVKAR